jgi:hypothetical protein
VYSDTASAFELGLVLIADVTRASGRDHVMLQPACRTDLGTTAKEVI